MKTVLIPTDFSENAWNALEYAISLFSDISCDFYIIHVAEVNQSSVQANSFPFPKAGGGLSATEPDQLFQNIARLPANEKHHFTFLQEYGNLIPRLRQVVDEKKIDLIIMGTKGASGIKGTVVGSNTGDVITRIHCEVLVVPEDAAYHPIAQIAFPTDYNIFYNHTILGAITEIVRLTQADLSVLNVARPHSYLSPSQENNREFLFDYLQESFPNQSTFHSVAGKNINQAIQDFIILKNVGMLVMAAKNLNFLQQLFFDTTIEKLSFHSRVPLLVLHE